MKPEPKNRKRSIYMDRSVSEEIERLAAAHCRSISLQISWLVTAGLQTMHRFPDAPVVELEDAEQRVYFYPPPALARRLDRAVTALNKRSKERNIGGIWHWSFSAMARVLLDRGLTVEWWIERQLEHYGRRIAAEAVGPSPRGYAMHLVVGHTAREIAAISPDEADPDTLARWRIDDDTRRDALAVAFEARQKIEELSAGDDA